MFQDYLHSASIIADGFLCFILICVIAWNFFSVKNMKKNIQIKFFQQHEELNLAK